MSAFTALNGGSPKTSEARSVTSDKPGDEQPSSHSTTRPDSAKDGPKDAWPNHGKERTPLQSAPYPHASDSYLKRKRSGSPEIRREPPLQLQTPDTATLPPHGNQRDPFGTPRRDHRYSEEVQERDAWYSQHSRDERNPADTQGTSAVSPQGDSEEQLSEALRRATGSMERGEYDDASPRADDQSTTYGSQYGPDDHRQSSMSQHDLKKRKRNFSNRTKTGCMTCRGRKKKCDEGKPECQNCIRGQFVCTGYPPQRGSGWQKPDSKTPAVPLESKDPSYVPPGAYGMPQQSTTYTSQPVKREPLPPYRGQAPRIDPPQGRPLVTDDDRPTASTLPSASVVSSDNKLSAMSYGPGQNVFPTPISANTQTPTFGERMAKDYQRVPPLHDLSRTEPETPHPGNQLPQINILHASRTTSPSGQQGQASNAQVAAQLALSHSQYPQRRTQKEEMLSGRHFYPFDKELCLERERCASACWRFNNLTSPPSHGVSAEERSRLFLEILQPRDPVRITEVSPVTNVGRVGRHVTVEAPFFCDYGYNITIGNYVAIGRNCTINDVCEVKIGDNSVIGPNVSVFTATLPIDPKRRQGGQGPQYGKSITIEQDCWIAGGAMILAGTTIGKGSTVGAGSIVTKDVPPFTIVAGNPARVLRGIAS